MYRRTLSLLCWCTISSLSASAFGASAVQGRMTSDGVTGTTVIGAGWVLENLYVGQLSIGFGAGATTTGDPPPGSYTISGAAQLTGFLAGTYELFTFSFDNTPAFSYRTIQMPAGQGTLTGMELRTPAHYSVRYNESYAEWGGSPWIWGTDFYQTFVATSPYLTRLAVKLASKEGDHQPLTLNFAVYQTNAYPPSAWRQISPVRSVYIGGNVDPIIWIFHVNYRSNEVPLVPGRTYAARFWRASASPSQNFAIVARTDAHDGYAGGQLYSGDTAYANLDAYAYISGGAPDTVVNHAPADNTQLLTFAGTSTRFGQTFRASGEGLAGVETVYATGDLAPPSVAATFQLYDSVGGSPIGLAKKCYGVPGYYQARVAAFWSRGEAPLVAGQMYYLEWTTPLPGVNTWVMNENLAGEAYINRVSQAPTDLMMSIAEYISPSPIISADPADLTRRVMVGTDLAQDSFTISNAGGGTLNYTLSSNAAWLAATPASGSSTGEADPITITYSTASLAVGSYTGQITIAAPGATNTPSTVTVHLLVEGPPRILSTTALSASGTTGADAPAISFTIQNGGFGTINYSLQTDNTWMYTDPTGGACDANADTITVHFQSASLSAGTHTGTITITSPEAVNSPLAIRVTLTVSTAQDLDGDSDVDLSDFTLFQLCFNGPNRPPGPGCTVKADFDGDGDVDLADFGLFQACFNGPSRPPLCR